jgi:hypothetical protein
MQCSKHPDTETQLSCARCEKAICPKCLVHAPVGIRCRDCAPARPARTRRGIGILGGAVVVILVIVVGASLASGSSNSGSDDSAGYLDGYYDFEGVVTVNEVIDPFAPENADERPSEGRRFVAFDVTIENSEDAGGPHYVNSYLFKLTDSENFAYERSLATTEPTLAEELELAPGEKTRGWVMFEVEKGSDVKSLEYWTADVVLPGPDESSASSR